MPKVKSTAAYREADSLNKQLKNMYQKFGEESEVYQLYVNRLSASLPPGAIHTSSGGFIQVSKGKSSGLTASQLKAARKGLPSVQQATTTYKRQVAEEHLASKGINQPSESQIQREAKTVTKEEVKRYVDAKSYVKAKEDSKGKLIYNESVADLMKTAGAKSYELLAAILQEGENRDNAQAQEEAGNAARVEAGYENGKAKVMD